MVAQTGIPESPVLDPFAILAIFAIQLEISDSGDFRDELGLLS